MRILQVISTGPFAWGMGGPSRCVFELSRALVLKGHEVTILTTDLYQATSRYDIVNNPEHIDGVQVYRLRNISNKLGWKYHISISLGIKKFLKSHIYEYDVVHLQDLLSLLAIVTAKYCNKMKIPYILSPHGSVPWLDENKPINKLYKRFYGNEILLKATKVICLNQIEASQCRNMGFNEDKIEIVPNGINLSEFECLPNKGEFRRKWAISANNKIILFLARIHKIKGPDLLAKAFSIISMNGENVKLVFAGPDDGYLKILNHLVKKLEIENDVIFTGPLYGRDKLEAYVDADVYILPSNYEIFGISVLEAMACGTPVIVGDRCGIADVIRNTAGLVIPLEIKTIGHSLTSLLNEAELSKSFADSGRKLASSFNWKIIAGRIEAIYQKIKIENE